MAKNKKEKKKLLGILNIILCFILIGAAFLFYIAIDEQIITINQKKINNPNINENNKKEKIKKEQIITDSNLIMELKHKVNNLNANKSYMNHIIPNLYKEEKITYIDIQNKLHLVLESLSNSYTNITVAKSEIEKSIGSYYTNLVIEENKQIPISKVKQRYKELFGSDIDQFIHIEGCPSYFYDVNNEVYYMTTKCSKGEGINKEYVYDYQYTTIDNIAYVYVSVATAFTTNYTLTEVNEPTINIYKGYSNAIYKEEISLKELENFKIDKENYQDFDIYQYKFIKDQTTNTYYFSSVEKVIS